jgi:hypothetical protein
MSIWKNWIISIVFDIIGTIIVILGFFYVAMTIGRWFYGLAS